MDGGRHGWTRRGVIPGLSALLAATVLGAPATAANGWKDQSAPAQAGRDVAAVFAHNIHNVGAPATPPNVGAA